MHVEEEKKKRKACRDLIQETAKKMIKAIDLESLERMEALYENMKKIVEKNNNSLETISKLEKTLQTYIRNLGVSIAGKIAFKIILQLSLIFYFCFLYHIFSPQPGVILNEISFSERTAVRHGKCF